MQSAPKGGVDTPVFFGKEFGQGPQILAGGGHVQFVRRRPASARFQSLPQHVLGGVEHESDHPDRRHDLFAILSCLRPGPGDIKGDLAEDADDATEHNSNEGVNHRQRPPLLKHSRPSTFTT